MSWLYAQAWEALSEESLQPSHLPDLLLLSKGKPMPWRSLLRAWMKGGWIRRLSGLTYAPSTASRGVELWISSLRATRAKAKAMPGLEPGPTTSSGSGMTCGELFARWDRATSSWRTSQLTLDGVFDTYSETCPRQGGLRNGSAFARPMWAPRTSETGSSSLLPTPRANKWGFPDSHGNTSAWLPTPRATDGTKGGPNQRGSSGDLTLPSAAARMLPTPTSMDYKASGAAGYSTESGRHAGTTLTDAVVRYPTPMGRDWKGRSQKSDLIPTAAGEIPGSGRVLNPQFVEWMMGWPVGWTCVQTDCTCAETVSFQPKVPQPSASSGKGSTDET